MSTYHYYIVELDLPEVNGTCTINGNPGFSTPLTCADQDTYTTTIKTHKFTDTGLVLTESDIYKCVSKIAETTPKLKAGNGVASRATCTITINDFVGDPNMSSPALIDNPSIENQGTFFGKLKSRNIISNKSVRVKYYKQSNSVTTLIQTNYYIATDIKRNGSQRWTITCKDVLFKADDEKSQFPKIVTATLNADITSGQTSVVINADIADWTDYDDYTAVIGNDLLMITNATGSSTSVTLTTVRSFQITLGSRIIINTPDEHSAGDQVFRARKFINADLFDVIEKVFEDSDISTSEYDGTEIESELDTWIPNVAGSIDAIIYEPTESTKFLDSICSTFMLDIWTDTSVGKIRLKATSPWNTTTSILTEGEQIEYGSISIDEPADLRYSRAFLQYDKRKLTESDEDVNFTRSSLALNRDLEGELFYDEEKVKKLGKSIILSNKTSNIETADLTTVRHAQRFSNRPQIIKFNIEESDINFKLADVIEINTADNQDFYGNPKQSVRAQVTQITPKYSIGRTYTVRAITYNPFIGGISGTDISVNNDRDVNLFSTAGGPVSSGTYTFIFDKACYGQNSLAQAITTGSFPSGSTLNLVFVSGSTAVGAGGKGAEAPIAIGSPMNGYKGGNTLVCVSGLTINIYLSGTTPDFGNGTYTANGYLYAAGGGGASGGKDAFDPSDPGAGYDLDRAAGGGGAGCNFGTAGTGTGTAQPSPVITTAPTDGTQTLGGLGASVTGGDIDTFGGDGGDVGLGGGNATGGDQTGTGGAAGKALILNTSTLNIFTNGNTSRFVQGAGDAPTSIT